MKLTRDNILTACGWMRTELNLSGTDLIIYAVIYSYTQFGQNSSYNEGQDLLADWAGVDVRTVKRRIKFLLDTGLISQEHTLFGNDVYRTISRGDILSPRGDICAQNGGQNVPSNILNITNKENNNNIIIKEKSEKEAKIEARAGREQNFRESLEAYKESNGGDYPDVMVDDFFLYWSEPNRSGDRMKFELQQTFDISRRLITWNRNNETKYARPQQPTSSAPIRSGGTQYGNQWSEANTAINGGDDPL